MNRPLFVLDQRLYSFEVRHVKYFAFYRFTLASYICFVHGPEFLNNHQLQLYVFFCIVCAWCGSGTLGMFAFLMF